jgi:hypothetical protein
MLARLQVIVENLASLAKYPTLFMYVSLAICRFHHVLSDSKRSNYFGLFSLYYLQVPARMFLTSAHLFLTPSFHIYYYCLDVSDNGVEESF